MIIPYVTAHFGKPLPETLGAIVTGLVLGTLALRHRSFWLGVAAHYGVALTMDLSAMVRQGIKLV
jgi:membrane protease YdiL (CAAX protease family)